MIYYSLTILFLLFYYRLTIVYLSFFPCFIVLFFYDKAPLMGDKSLFSNAFSIGRSVKNMFLMSVSYFLLKPFNLLFFNCKEVVYV